MQECTQKDNNKKNSGIWQLFLRTMRTMGKRRFMYYGSILGMSITFAMFSVMEAFLMKIVVDIAQKGEWDRLISSVVIIVITGVIVLLGYRFACIRYNVEAKRIYGKLYEQVLSHEMKLPCEYYENHHSGEMLSKVSFDLGRMGDIFGSRFRRVVMPFIMVVVFLVPMFALSWQLTLCLVAVNTVLIGVTMVLTGPLKSLSKKMSESNSIMTKHITDLIQGIIQVRMFPAGRKTVDRYNEEADVYAVKSDKRNMFSSLLECANTGFDLICNLVFLALGILFVQKGYTTLGAIAAIYTMYGRFSRQFLQMGKYIPELIAYLTYAQNIFDFLDEETEDKSKKLNKSDILNHKDINEDVVINEINNFCGHNTILNNADYSVKISDLTFSYIKDENNAPIVVLDNYNERIKSGEFVAVTGASGSGKTTLFHVLSGLTTPEEGKVFLNGEDITSKPGQISYMLQKDLLFPHKKIIDNTALPLVLHGMKKKEAREKAQMYFKDFGLEGTEYQYPSQLSGGMRQRAALLRTYLSSNGVALLDEPFSALDTITKTAIHKWYLEVMQHIDLSTIFITHDIDEAILLSDRIYILNGKPGEIRDEIVIKEKKPRAEDFYLTDQFLAYKRKIIAKL